MCQFCISADDCECGCGGTTTVASLDLNQPSITKCQNCPHTISIVPVVRYLRNSVHEHVWMPMFITTYIYGKAKEEDPWSFQGIRSDDGRQLYFSVNEGITKDVFKMTIGCFCGDFKTIDAKNLDRDNK